MLTIKSIIWQKDMEDTNISYYGYTKKILEIILGIIHFKKMEYKGLQFNKDLITVEFISEEKKKRQD